MKALRYQIDEHPKLSVLPLFGLQHVLTMLGATVAVPSIIAGAYGLNSAQTALLISNVLIAMGLATLIQTRFGTRLPIIQGSSFAFLPALLYVSSIHSGAEGLAYASGAIIVGAILQSFLGISKVAGLIQRVLTPVVIGPTILVIGLSLFSVGGNQASSNWPLALTTIALIMVFSFGLSFRSRDSVHVRSWTSVFPVVLAIGVLWVGCAAGSLFGLIQESSAAFVNLTNVASSNPIKLSNYIFPWGMPQFDLSFLLIFIIAYLVSTVESIGDYNAVNDIARRDPEELAPETVNKGIMAEGFGCFFAGLMGANPTTSYGENIGVIGITGVASRVVVMVAAGLLLVAGLLPVVGALLASIPTPVMGGLYCVLFGMIAGIGLRYAVKADLSSMRNVSIMGFSIFFGFAIPSVFASAELKAATIELMGSGFGDVFLGVVTSNMDITAFSALFWDLLLAKD